MCAYSEKKRILYVDAVAVKHWYMSDTYSSSVENGFGNRHMWVYLTQLVFDLPRKYFATQQEIYSKGMPVKA